MKYKVPISGQWQEFSDNDLKKLRDSGKKDVADALFNRYEESQKNPLAYFLPHGIEWSDEPREVAGGRFIIPPRFYPKKYKNDGVAFLSDRINDICLLLGPNQTGKTKIGSVWTALRLVPTEPWWPIFAEHGVEWYEWEGPKIWVAASYSWDNVETVWRRYQETLPREELGQYAPNYGKYPGEDKTAKDLTFGDGKTKKITLKCGSKILFRCYTQQQFHWEGFETDGQHADEQEPEEMLTGWQRGTTTRGEYTPCCMTLTGHEVDGRPDTGAAGPIKREIYDPICRAGVGETKYGRCAVYHLSVDSTPDAVIIPKKRRDLNIRWVEKEDSKGNPIVRSEKDERAAIARYWGGWEEGSGLYFDTDIWQRSIHMIVPLWADNNVPKTDIATLYRVIDYGDTGTTACSWWAVTKHYAFLYRLLYETNLTVNQAASKIITMSHNEKILVDEERNDLSGNVVEYFEERVTSANGETIFRNILDGRSFDQRQQGETIGSLFTRHGINVIPANMQHNANQLPLLREWLTIDFTKDHPFNVDKNGVPLKGCPRVFFFDLGGSMNEAVSEIEHYPNDPKQRKKVPDHFIDTAKYWASHGPEYWGNYEETPYEEEYEEDEGTPFTGA